MTIAEPLALGSDDQRDAFRAPTARLHADVGDPALLEAIASTYDTLGPEHVLIFAGAEEAIFWSLQELIGAASTPW